MEFFICCFWESAWVLRRRIIPGWSINWIWSSVARNVEVLFMNTLHLWIIGLWLSLASFDDITFLLKFMAHAVLLLHQLLIYFHCLFSSFIEVSTNQVVRDSIGHFEHARFLIIIFLLQLTGILLRILSIMARCYIGDRSIVVCLHKVWRWRSTYVILWQL